MTNRIRAGVAAFALGAAFTPAGVLMTSNSAAADPPPHSDRTCAGSDPHGDDGPQWYSSPQDLDNDGFSDIAVGVPGATVGGKADAGVVDVHFAVDQAGAPSSQRVSLSDFTDPEGRPYTATAGDRFGASSTYVDANHDNCVDLAIGIPGAEDGRGAVLLVLGSPSGLSLTDASEIDGDGPGDHFGTSLTAQGEDLYIGIPGQRVGTVKGAGAVDATRVEEGHFVNGNYITEASAGIPGAPEPNDHFGAVVAANSYNVASGNEYLAIGEPDKDVGSATNAGKVTILRYGIAEAFTQNSPGVPDSAETGDHFGAALAIQGDGFAVGVPGENVNGVKDAGLVQLFSQDDTHLAKPLETITQRTTGVPGPLGAGAQFGAGLVEYASSIPENNRPLAISAPGAQVGSAAHAGVVLIGNWRGEHEFRGPLVFSALLHQGTSGVGGTPEAGDRFGAGLSALDDEDWDANDPDGDDRQGGSVLVISTPGEDVGAVGNAGALQVDYDYDSPGTTTLYDSAGPIAGEQYGNAAYGNLNFSLTSDD